MEVQPFNYTIEIKDKSVEFTHDSPMPSLFRGAEHDKETFLKLAGRQDLPPTLKKELFSKASMLLRGNDGFMKQVLDVDPSLFVCATVDAQTDLYLALHVFSQSPEIVKRYVGELSSNQWKTHPSTKRFVAWLLEKLEVMFGSYDGVVLQIIKQSNLNLGEETSDHFLRLILEYLWGWEVPDLVFMRMCRRAYENLAKEKAIVQRWNGVRF